MSCIISDPCSDCSTLLQDSLEEEGRAATLEVLLTALSSQEFKDIKMRIESLVKLPS